jgi:alanine-glyoxylate transaminase/(R)-3-amino-2-methylpropionate-pyruvate transaminase
MDQYKAVFFNTFGGGHLQCLVGMEVLKTIRQENLHLNAEKIGNYLLQELSKLKEKYDIIGDVRGAGLMIGVEMVKNKQTHEPSKDICNDMMELTRERHLLFGKGGAFGNTLRIQPPMCLTMEDAKYIVDALEDSVIAYGRK